MSYFTPEDIKQSGSRDRYEDRGAGSGWLIVIGLAVVILIAILAFGSGGGDTSTVHPGGAGAPPVITDADPADAGVAPAAPAAELPAQ